MDGTPIGRDATMSEIEAASDALLGHTFADIARSEMADHDAVRLKGQLGELLETYYGMDHDNDPDPDFRQVGLELKCKPLKTSYGDLFYPKEPLSVGMIDYAEVADTRHWRDIEKLRKKFLNLIIVWFHHDGGDRTEFPFVWWQHWSPSERLDQAIQAEYETIRRQVLDGEHLSQTEADNDILQTCPKHNADFAQREPGSYVTSGHPTLDKPERRSWRIPCRFLVEMLAEDAGLDLVPKGRTRYVDQEALLDRAEARARDAAPLGRYLPADVEQTGMSRFRG